MNIPELIGCALSGDTRAVEGLYNTTRDSIYYLCLRLVGKDEDAASGMLQSTYMHLFGKLGLLKDPDSFEAWGFTTAAKRCRAYLSGSGKPIDFSKTAVPVSDDAGAATGFPYSGDPGARSEVTTDMEACAIVENAVDRLPDAERFCTMLFFYCGLSPDHIARNLQTTPDNVRKSIISGAMQIGENVKRHAEKIPALEKYRGAAELSAILSVRSGVLRVSDRVSDTIIATGMSMIAASAEMPELQDFTYNDSAMKARETEGAAPEKGKPAAGGILLVLLLILLLGGVIALAVKIVPTFIGGEPVDTPKVTDSDTVPDTDPVTDTAPVTDESTTPDTDPVSPPVTDAVTEPVTEAPVTDVPDGSPEPVPADYKAERSADGSITITGYTGTETAITIPSEIDGVPVKAIGDSAFAGNTVVRSVTIPNGVEYIGVYAFKDCTALEDIVIPDSVKSVGRSVLVGSKWLDAQTDDFVIVGDGVLIKINTKNRDIVVPDGVKFISNVFYYVGTVENITLPETTWGIGEFAFAVCVKLTNVNIPASVTTIHDGAFYQCDALASITVEQGSAAAQWCAAHGFGGIVKEQ